MNIKTKRCLILFAILLSVIGKANAQVLHITGNIYKNMKSAEGGYSKVPLSVPVYIFDNRNEANKQADSFRKKSKDISQEVTIRSNATVNSDYEGHFEADISAKGAIMVINEGEVKVVNISSKLQYDMILYLQVEKKPFY